MEKSIQEAIMINSLNDSIEREELLMKKYKDFEMSIQDAEFKELLEEFKEISHEHIALVKGKLSKLKF
jgi:hypothetical protein